MFSDEHDAVEHFLDQTFVLKTQSDCWMVVKSRKGLH